MRKSAIVSLAVLGVVLGCGAGASVASALSSPAVAPAEYCVTYGHGAGAAGNVIEYNWDHSRCPAGTYPYTPAASDSFILNELPALSDVTGRAFDISTSAGRFTCGFAVPARLPAVQQKFSETVYGSAVECFKL